MNNACHNSVEHWKPLKWSMEQYFFVTIFLKKFKNPTYWQQYLSVLVAFVQILFSTLQFWKESFEKKKKKEKLNKRDKCNWKKNAFKMLTLFIISLNSVFFFHLLFQLFDNHRLIAIEWLILQQLVQLQWNKAPFFQRFFFFSKKSLKKDCFNSIPFLISLWVMI